MPRTYWFVVRSGDEWQVKLQDRDSPVSTHGTQAEAIDAAVEAAKDAYSGGTLSGVRVQGEDNAWREERTYGSDPNPPPG
jgi:hypothetical protein